MEAYISTKDGLVLDDYEDVYLSSMRQVGKKDEIPIFVEKEWKKPKRQKTPKKKEYRLKTTTHLHDIQVKVDQALKHIKKGNHVRFTLKLTSRERPIVALKVLRTASKLMGIKGTLTEKDKYYTLTFHK